MVRITRLLTVKKETIYKVFTITDPALVSFVMKMIDQLKKLKHNTFSSRQGDIRDRFETQKDFALAKYSNILYSVKKSSQSGNFYLNGSGKKPKTNRHKILIKKLRIFKMNSVFDSITFSKDFLDCIDSVLECFDTGKFH